MNGHTGKSLNEISSYISIYHVKIPVKMWFHQYKNSDTNNDEEKATLVQSHGVHLKNADLARKSFLLIYKNPYPIQNYRFQLNIINEILSFKRGIS